MPVGAVSAPAIPPSSGCGCAHTVPPQAPPAGPSQGSTHGSLHDIPNLPDLSTASAEDLSRATALRDQLITNTWRYRDPAVARAEGYEFDFTKLKRPNQRFLHVKNPALISDGANADPTRPEVLLYQVGADHNLTLVGVMFSTEPGGVGPDIGALGRWHRHGDNPQAREMMHVWFTNDLATSFAQKPPRAAIDHFLAQL